MQADIQARPNRHKHIYIDPPTNTYTHTQACRQSYIFIHTHTYS